MTPSPGSTPSDEGPAIAVEHPDFAPEVRAVGLRVVAEGDPSAVAFVAASVAGARRAQKAEVPFILRVAGSEERAFMEHSHQVECLFVDAAGLRERLLWLEDRGWRAPERRPDRVDLIDAISQQRAWLENLREAEVQAQIAHEEAAVHQERHERRVAALDRDRVAFEARIAEMEATVAWRVHMALAKLKRRAQSLVRRRES